MFSQLQRRTAVACFAGLALCIGGCANQPKITDERAPVAVPPGYVAPIDQLAVLGSDKLGAPVSEFQGMTLVEKLGAWETYTRPSDRLSFQKAELNSITYNFFSGRLYSIHVEVMGIRNTQRLVKWTEKAFGPYFKVEVKSYGDKYNKLISREWQGDRVDFVFQFAEDFEGGTMMFVDHKMWVALDHPRRERITRTMRSMEGSWTNLDFD